MTFATEIVVILLLMAASTGLADVRRLLDRSEFEQAESRLKQILASDPTNWAALLLLWQKGKRREMH